MCKKRRKGRIDFETVECFRWLEYFFFSFYRKYSFLVKKFLYLCEKRDLIRKYWISFGKELFNGVEEGESVLIHFLIVLRYRVCKKKYSALFVRVLCRKKFDDSLNLSIITLFNVNIEYYYSVSIENTNILFSYLINKTTICRCVLLFISNFPFFFFFGILTNETRMKFLFQRKRNRKYKCNK